jgi:hypothetical protein
MRRADRSESLEELVAEAVMTFARTRTLSQALAARDAEVAGPGEEEVAEGLARLAVPKGVAETSEELAQTGEELVAQGIVEMAEGAAIASAAPSEEDE